MAMMRGGLDFSASRKRSHKMVSRDHVLLRRLAHAEQGGKDLCSSLKNVPYIIWCLHAMPSSLIAKQQAKEALQLPGYDLKVPRGHMKTFRRRVLDFG